MKTVVFGVLILLSSSGMAQSKIWAKLEKGSALYLDPYKNEWIPLGDKQELPMKTFLMTKENARVSLFKETDVFIIAESAYCFIEDAIAKTKAEVVSALTQIEAAELPALQSEPKDKKKTVGLTYGATPNEADAASKIPYLKERENAVQWFYAQNQFDAALLSHKRMMVKFPALYQSATAVELLLQLYDKLELYGFLGDETRRLMAVQKSAELSQIVVKWSETAKIKLAKQRR
jgi:hypothetical protein